MQFPKNAMVSFSDKEVVDNLVDAKKIYDDISSLNTNNPNQKKSKFKLCISLAATLDNILDGKIFGVSCSYTDWHCKVKHIKVERIHYTTCTSRKLNNGTSAYLPQNMEILSYSEIRQKIADDSNGFHLKAELVSEKYESIRTLFNNHLSYSKKTSQSVETIKALIAETADLSVLRYYGVEIGN